MTRTNTPASLDHWATQAASAPFRASIRNDVSWIIGHPSPDLIAASRVCPGGRLLLAFTLEALRDYFVEGYTDQGAQVEPDHATRAHPFHPHAHSRLTPVTLDQAIAQYHAAVVARQALASSLNDAFVRPAQTLFDGGQIMAAMAQLKAMPDHPLRTQVVLTYRADPQWHAAVWARCEAALPTPDQAILLRDAQRAAQALERATHHLDAQFRPEFQAAQDRQDRGRLVELAAQMPTAFERAVVLDALRQLPSVDGVVPRRPRASR